MSENKATLIGRLGGDPEVVSFQNNGRVCRLNVATSESWTDTKTKERKEETEWHRVEVWHPATIDFLIRTAKKGSQVYVVGKIKYGSYTDKAGVKQNTTTIIVRAPGSRVDLLGGKNDSGGERQTTPPSRKESRNDSTRDENNGGFADNKDDLDDLPNFFNDGKDDENTF